MTFTFWVESSKHGTITVALAMTFARRVIFCPIPEASLFQISLPMGFGLPVTFSLDNTYYLSHSHHAYPVGLAEELNLKVILHSL